MPPPSSRPLTHPLHLRKRLAVLVQGNPVEVDVDTELAKVLPHELDGLPVVAALVDKKATSLLAPITTTCAIEPLTPRVWEGQRIWRQSLALLVLEAAAVVAPEERVRMGPSVGFGQRILVPGLSGSELAEFGVRLELQLHALAERGVPLREELWSVEETQEHFRARGRTDAEHLLATWRDTTVPLVAYGSVYAIAMGPLVPDTRPLGACYVLCDENYLLLVYGRRSPHSPKPTHSLPSIALTEVGEREPESTRTQRLLLSEARSSGGSSYAVTFEEQAWLHAIGVTSVGSWNRACIEGSVPELIRVCEAFHEKHITTIADEIQRRTGEVDIVCIAGPSCSGKTTFIRRLCVQLKVNGIGPVGLGLDDYYVDRELTPRDASGDYDYEALEALQLDLLHDHLERLLRRESVTTSRYDFKTGKGQSDGGRTLSLGPHNVLLIEGIHGLNPALLGDIAPSRVFRVFVCPMMQLSFDHAARVHASDVRLIRRIVRDRHGRGNKARETIARWPKVRAGERQHIYPYQRHADAVFDSSLVYELSTLRVYAERYLLEVPRHDPAFTTAFRLSKLLDRFVSIHPDHVPDISILREFIGGSGFES